MGPRDKFRATVTVIRKLKEKERQGEDQPANSASDEEHDLGNATSKAGRCELDKKNASNPQPPPASASASNQGHSNPVPGSTHVLTWPNQPTHAHSHPPAAGYTQQQNQGFPSYPSSSHAPSNLPYSPPLPGNIALGFTAAPQNQPSAHPYQGGGFSNSLIQAQPGNYPYYPDQAGNQNVGPYSQQGLTGHNTTPYGEPRLGQGYGQGGYSSSDHIDQSHWGQTNSQAPDTAPQPPYVVPQQGQGYVQGGFATPDQGNQQYWRPIDNQAQDTIPLQRITRHSTTPAAYPQHNQGYDQGGSSPFNQSNRPYTPQGFDMNRAGTWGYPIRSPDSDGSGQWSSLA